MCKNDIGVHGMGTPFHLLLIKRIKMGKTKDLFIEQREYEAQEEDMQEMWPREIYFRAWPMPVLLSDAIRWNKGETKEKT